MKKTSPALVVALIALVFAGAILVRVAIVSRLSGMPETTEEKALATSDRPTVMWSVRSSSDEDPKGYSYSLITKQIAGTMEGFEGPGGTRFNQSTNLCDRDYQDVPLNIECNYNSIANVLILTVYGMMDEEKWMRAYTVDLKDLGAFTSLADGYLTPVAVADDKSAIYLGRRVETESYVAGLWRLDVSSGAITEISSVRDRSMYQYDINPVEKQLVGAAFSPPESLGESPGLPSSIFFVDLTNGEMKQLVSSHAGTAHPFANENPMLSESASHFSFFSDDEFGTSVYTVATPRLLANFPGVAKDWFEDTVVVDRDGNLFLYDLKTNAETQLTFETDATVEYLGVVR